MSCMKDDKLSGAEAIYAFCAWLTTRKQPVTMSSRHNCAVIPPLIKHFCETQGLDKPRDDYHEKIKPTNDVYIEKPNLFNGFKSAGWKNEVKSFDVSGCEGSGRLPDGNFCKGCISCMGEERGNY